MIYSIEVIQLRGEDNYIESFVEASNPAEALKGAGFTPDSEDSCYSGAGERNEYGYPWYPHRSADLASSFDIVEEFKDSHPEFEENRAYLLTSADGKTGVEVEDDRYEETGEVHVFSVFCEKGKLQFKDFEF